MEECARCKDSDGDCHYDTIYDVDGLVYSQNFTCDFYGDYNTVESRSSEPSTGVLIGIGISVGSLFLAAVIYASYKLIKKTRTRRRRDNKKKPTRLLLIKCHFSYHVREKAIDLTNIEFSLGGQAKYIAKRTMSLQYLLQGVNIGEMNIRMIYLWLVHCLNTHGSRSYSSLGLTNF
ncbi:protein kinase-like domain-containing protein [Artemisia annua]|uniref:Protein kinase-like domain-containing protein n=1 Tax=Artemisia annua TaxID=35608 RepID=A0A2U1MD67_ARTAN|nr:protein kinase-like domain-containing protein [Artemisia annua]